MLTATALVLFAALAVGLWLATIGGWPILALGLLSLVCAIAYTGGPYPLAYHGLGDLFVLLFFGLVAVLGSAWLQIAHLVGRIPAEAALRPGMSPRGEWILGLPGEWWLIATAIGLQATAIIAVNNLRDIATDARVGKRTLAVRLGDRASRTYYGLLHLVAALCWWAAVVLLAQPWLALSAAIASVGGILLTRGVARSHGADLNRYLARSAALELITGLSAVAALRI
jgi:1,4-dihydroxy-2-naphthoate octaprenyltransferase